MPFFFPDLLYNGVRVFNGLLIGHAPHSLCLHVSGFVTPVVCIDRSSGRTVRLQCRVQYDGLLYNIVFAFLDAVRCLFRCAGLNAGAQIMEVLKRSSGKSSAGKTTAFDQSSARARVGFIVVRG